MLDQTKFFLQARLQLVGGARAPDFPDSAEGCLVGSGCDPGAMDDVDSLTTAMSVLGTVTSLFRFLSPAKHFRGIVKTRNVGQWSGTPYLIGFAQCLLWFV